VDLDVNLFEFFSTFLTCGHQYKLYKHHTNHCVRSSFFCEWIINVSNSLPSSVNFRSINSFKQSIGSVDFYGIFEVFLTVRYICTHVLIIYGRLSVLF